MGGRAEEEAGSGIRRCMIPVPWPKRFVERDRCRDRALPLVSWRFCSCRSSEGLLFGCFVASRRGNYTPFPPFSFRDLLFPRARCSSPLPRFPA